MSRIYTYLKRTVIWLAEPTFAWVGLGITVLLVYFALREAATELQIRTVGLLFQWLGIGTVAWGLRKTRKLFGLPGFGEHLRKWLGRRPRWRRDITILAGQGAMNMSMGAGQLDVWSDVPATASPEAKLNAVIANVQYLRDGLQALRTKLDKVSSTHSEAIEGERRARAAEDTKLAARLHEAQTGGLNISILGAAWLFLGVLFSSLPGEIYDMCH